MSRYAVLVVWALSTGQHSGMPFDQAAVRHHFTLKQSGGTIEIEVRETSDGGSLPAVRTHLRHIARQFADGNFEAPFATHGEIPPGVQRDEQFRTRTVDFAKADVD